MCMAYYCTEEALSSMSVTTQGVMVCVIKRYSMTPTLNVAKTTVTKEQLLGKGKQEEEEFCFFKHESG